MRKTTYTESAHTADTTQPPADASQATNGLPNRLMTAFEVACVPAASLTRGSGRPIERLPHHAVRCSIAAG
jgi:hypothetical protein